MTIQFCNLGDRGMKHGVVRTKCVMDVTHCWVVLEVAVKVNLLVPDLI